MPVDAPHIVLVGAGHAHLHVASHAGRLNAAGGRVTLISPGSFWYSGMASGMLGGEYSADDDRLDPVTLIESAGGRFIRDRIVAVDRERRLLHLAQGAPLAYDLASFNLGSRVATPSLPGLHDARDVWSAKPIDNLWRLRERLETLLAAGTAPRLVILGGGPTGVELAANLLALGERYGRPLELSLIHPGKRLLEQAPRGASRWIGQRLRRRGLRIELATDARAYRDGAVILDDGTTLAADHLVLATGLSAPQLTGELGLLHHPHHGLAITAELHTPEDERIFAVGDCAWLREAPYPKLGVFGVRQGPVLLANLEARLQEKTLQPFRPQRRYLSILNLGDGRGLALWGRLWWAGRLALSAKRRLDHDFMARYRAAATD